MATPPSSRTTRQRVVDYWHRYLNKPYYFRTPKRLIYRLAGDRTRSEIRLPWGLPLGFLPGSTIGTKLIRNGVHDLVLSEALFRLTDPMDVCVDAGANIGYTTSLLAVCSGPEGRVLSYEPAPDMFAILSENIRSWRGIGIARIDACQMALSNIQTRLTLATPAAHRGDSSSRTVEQVDDPLAEIGVQSTTIDAIGLDYISLLKIDVEGHECSVLRGCERLLSDRKIRDVIFEEYEQPPTAVTRELAEAGYTVFRIEQGLRRPRLVSDLERTFEIYWDAPNYLGTIEPARALERFQRGGWRCLRPGRG